MNASMLTLTPLFSFSLLSCTRNASRSVISASFADGTAAAAPGTDAGADTGAAVSDPDGETATAAAPPSVTSVNTTAPSETLSPTLTTMSRTVPPRGAGTSIVALSDSSVTSASSGLTVSPGLTRISITGTSLKSPMSGTRTSATPAGALAGAGGDDTAVFGGAAGAAFCSVAPDSSTRIGLPSLTLSPTFTFKTFTVPATGAGTSIVALSDSSAMSESSA